ncbi:MAG: hypothetical protein IBJ11_00090 [Phycisphaerales bacterium]|nr:hypothetical protein [Phycisphaerales bacterium]
MRTIWLVWAVSVWLLVGWVISAGAQTLPGLQRVRPEQLPPGVAEALAESMGRAPAAEVVPASLGEPIDRSQLSAVSGFGPGVGVRGDPGRASCASPCEADASSENEGACFDNLVADPAFNFYGNNDGCLYNPPRLQSLLPGAKICGSTGEYRFYDPVLQQTLLYRDLDYYRLVVTSCTTSLKIFFQTQQDATIAIVTGPNNQPSCSGQLFVVNAGTSAGFADLDGCSGLWTFPANLQRAVFQPGEYWIIVASRPQSSPAYRGPYPCGGAYQLWVNGQQPTGACCLPNGTCTSTLCASQCQATGGIYQGDGTTCQTVQCCAIGPLPGTTYTEAEACSNGQLVNTNGGCGPGGLASEPIANEGCGVIIKGTSRTQGALNDASAVKDGDAYRFSTNTQRYYTVTVNAEFPVYVSIRSLSGPQDCTQQRIVAEADGPACTPLTVRACLPPGSYIVYIQPSFVGVSCADYTASITCGTCPTGACCLDNGTCTTVVAPQCASLGGVFRGEGSVCAAGVCCAPCNVPGLVGVPDGVCSDFNNNVVNGGCFESVPLFSFISAATPKWCGSVGIYLNALGQYVSEADFYAYTAVTRQQVTFRLTPSFRGELWGFTDCLALSTPDAGNLFTVAPSCTPTSLTRVVEAGQTYYFMVQPNVTLGSNRIVQLKCGAKYLAEFFVGPPPVVGACCLPNGTCNVQDQASCQSQGGIYRGNNTTCAAGACCPNPCAGGETPEAREAACSPGMFAGNDGCFGDSGDPTTDSETLNPAGEARCGTFGWYVFDPVSFPGAYRQDSDWYRLTLTQPRKVTLTTTALIPFEFWQFSGATLNCASPLGQVVLGTPCSPVTLQGCLPPGTYYFMLRPQAVSASNPLSGMPCSPYRLSLATEACTACPCPGDVDGNCSVGANDLTRLLVAFGSTAGPPPSPAWDAAADLDRNGSVGANDLTILLVNFGCQGP